VITDTINDPLYQPFLQDADLATSIETVRFTPTVLSLEELSKLWSVFFQTTYALSVAYQASLVLIEFGKVPPSPQPVLERGIYALPLDVPVVTGVTPQVASAGATITLHGSGFVLGQTTVRFGEGPAIVPAVVESRRIELPLPPTLRAGVHRITVTIDRTVTTPAGGTRTFPISASPVAVVLAPTVTGGPSFAVTGGNPFPLTIDPPVRRDQATRLLIGERVIAGPKLTPPPNEDNTVTFDIPAGFPNGTYPLRVEVGGIASQIRPQVASPGYAPSLVVT
jgi:hypothetical protein